jgi:hypothetical protein
VRNKHLRSPSETMAPQQSWMRKNRFPVNGALS